jgi:hypothetical protein
METPVASAAPAQPAPEAVPATSVAAADPGHVQTFLDARAAERSGTPREPVTVAPAVAAVAPATTEPVAEPAPERAVSKRQQQINDYERTIAELRQRVSALETPRPAAPAPAEPATPPEPEWKRIAKLPNAPKLAEFDSVEEHAAAMALFVSQTREQDRQTAAATDQRTRALHDQTQTFATRLHDAREADPDFLTKIPPQLLHVKPLSALTPGEPFTFGNVVMEAAFHASSPAALLTHLHSHPDEAARIGALPVDRQLWELGQLAGRLAVPSSPSPAAMPPAPPPPPSPISSFPSPQPALTRAASVADPTQAALTRHDVPGYLAARQAERLAKARAAGRTA